MFKLRFLVTAALVALLMPVASLAVEQASRIAGDGFCKTDFDCDDKSDCTSDYCNDGTCANLPIPAGIPCADDGIECTTNFCNGQGSCTHPNKPSGAVCGLPVQDACDEPDTCDGLGACIVHFAPAGTDCGEVQQQCFAETCDGVGTCTFQLISGPCDDWNVCTVLDTCEDGECVGADVDCSGAGDACNEAFCSYKSDGANCDELEPRKAGTPCEDDVFCDGLELCDGYGSCTAGIPACSKGEFCIESTDECLLGIDCNGNEEPDSCDLSCGSPGGSCDSFAECGLSVDCDGNGVPDECDVAWCPNKPSCDDCNQNGIPDACDIASGFSSDINPANGIPDECVTAAPGQHVWTGDIWKLDGGYPDNIQNVPDLYVTLNQSQVFLDKTVEIEGLRLRSGSVLEVTQIAEGDLLIDPIDSGGIDNRGTIVIGNNRVIDVHRGRFTIGEGGMLIGDPSAGNGVSASVITESLRLLPTFCGAPDQMTFRGAMTGTLFGDLELDGTGVSLCACLPQFCPASSSGEVWAQGGRTLPIFRHFSTAAVATRGDGGAGGEYGYAPALVVHGSFRVLFGAVVEVRPDAGKFSAPVAMQLAGDFDNQSRFPSLFDWGRGELILTSSPLPSRFEVGGIDLGPTFDGFDTNADALADPNPHSNFSMGAVRIVPGGDVTFVNTVANTISAGPCEEALYVHDLEFGAGSRITLDDCRIYFERLDDFGAQVEILGDCGALVQLATGDFNADEIVDLLDWSDFERCMDNGPGRAPDDPRCAVFDFDTDGDVDLVDAGRLTGEFESR